MENNALCDHRRKSSHVNSVSGIQHPTQDQLHQQSDISCQLAAISAQKARTQASLSQPEQQLGQEKQNAISLNSNCAIAILLNNSGMATAKNFRNPVNLSGGTRGRNSAANSSG